MRVKLRVNTRSAQRGDPLGQKRRVGKFELEAGSNC
jgi:hypothetical protein